MRKQRPPTGVPAPDAFFDKFLAQYGLNRASGANPAINPKSPAQYEQMAQRLERIAAYGKTVQARDYTGLGAAAGMFGGQTAKLQGIIGDAEQGARLQRLGSQVFAGAPGDYTNMYGGWIKGIQNEQSIGGTFDSLSAASQQAAGGAAFTNAARSALAGPLDSATMMGQNYLRNIFGSLGQRPMGVGAAGGGGAPRPAVSTTINKQQARPVSRAVGF